MIPFRKNSNPRIRVFRIKKTLETLQFCSEPRKQSQIFPHKELAGIRFDIYYEQSFQGKNAKYISPYTFPCNFKKPKRS